MRANSLTTVLFFLFAACGGGGGEAPVEEVRVEASAGNGPGSAEFLGTLGPEVTLEIRGAVTAFDADPFDTFLVDADEDTRVSFVLQRVGSNQVDLDLWLSTTEAEILETFDAGGTASETGSFDLAAGESRLLVVLSGTQDANYELRLEGTAPPVAPEE